MKPYFKFRIKVCSRKRTNLEREVELSLLK